MGERLYAISDTGATNSRVAVYNNRMELVGRNTSPTNPEDYESSLQLIADTAQLIAESKGEIVAASVAIGARVDQDGVITKAGGLTPWVGRNLREDVEAAFSLPAGRVGAFNDVVAIAISQHKINADNKRAVDGVAATLSSGFNDALYFRDGTTHDDEAAMSFCATAGYARAAKRAM